jgi:uncharacterized cupin superfamily protein
VSYRYVDAADVEPSFGVFRKMRQALGINGFGINQIDFPPGAEGREHSEQDGGQQELYIILAGSGTMRVDGEDVPLVPGRWLVVEPESTRMPTAGPDGMTMIMVGGTPDAAYVPRHGL